MRKKPEEMKAENVVQPDGLSDVSSLSAEDAKRSARRKFLAGGAAAAPFILTLSSRPVLGGGSYGGGGGYDDHDKCSQSGMMSANLSKPEEEICRAFTPGYWHDTNNWPSPGDDCPGGRWPNLTPWHKFSNCFGTNPFDRYKSYTKEKTYWGSYYTNPYLVDCLPTGCSHYVYPKSPTSLAGHAVAALCNSYFFGSMVFGRSPDDILDEFRRYGGKSHQINESLTAWLTALNEQ